MNLNKIQLIGRVTKDPETRATATGTPVAKFSLATNHAYKDKEGKKIETTQFHNIVAWGKLAELFGQYVTKGQELYICGRVEYRSWDKQDGTKGYITEVIVDDFQFGAKPKGERTAAEAVQEGARNAGDDGVRLEDIPF